MGEVIAVGDDVEGLAAGDLVATSSLGGGFREIQRVEARLAIPVPEASGAVLSILVSGLTASIALAAEGGIEGEGTAEGRTDLVTAAAGGTGQYAVQLAKRAGCRVFGTCSTDAKADLLRELGCDRPIVYTREDVRAVLKAEAPGGLDVAYESVGGELFDTAMRSLAQHGRLLTIGFIGEYVNGAERATGVRVYHRLLAKSASIRGFFLPHYSRHFREHMATLSGLVASGDLHVAVDPTEFRGLDAVVDAVEHLHSGTSQGKVVVRFD